MEFLTRTLYALPMAVSALVLASTQLGFGILTASVLFASAYEVWCLNNKRLKNNNITSTSSTSSSKSNGALCLVLIAMYSPIFVWSVFFLRSLHLIFYLFFVVWSTDVCALLVGTFSSTIKVFQGGTRILRFISEHKTISGCIGGIFGGTVIGVLYLRYQYQPDVSLLNAAFLSIITSSAAVSGDLIESAYKRICKAKDSDAFIKIPGHGGVLDRVDSILFAAPVCAFVWSTYTYKENGAGL
jgi:CDP-diglyceride synthetase